MNDDLNNNEPQVSTSNTEKNRSQLSGKYILLASIVLAVIITLVGVFSAAYAKYITKASGNATAVIASAVCKMEVVPYTGKEIVNPYCIVTVKNYDEENNVSQTDLNFNVTVTPNGDFVLPTCYWVDITDGQENETIETTSNVIAGTLGHTTKQSKQYKIVFVNPGIEGEALVRQLNFDLKATQRMPE